MVSKLNASEVLLYLSQLGYRNVTPLQLKEFMKDLKKLIKYEQRNSEEKIKDIFHPQQSTCTVAYADIPKKNEVPTERRQKVKYITLEINKPKASPNKKHENFQNKKEQFTEKQKCNGLLEISEEENSSCSGDYYSSEISECLCNKLKVGKKKCRKHLKDNKNVDVKQDVGVTDIEIKHVNKNFQNTGSSSCNSNYPNESRTNRSDSSYLPKTCTAISTKSSGAYDLKPKSSFIRPRPTQKSLKHDPVERYHFYQRQWSKCKLPGEDNHLRLRWAVREKIMGDPSVETMVGLCQSKSKKFK